MLTRRRITLIIAWALSLIIVGAFARAQTPAQRGGRADPSIISGSDLGFRIERQRGDHVTGTFVVRINGNWWDVEPTMVLKPLNGK
jgi:hypothetical protein